MLHDVCLKALEKSKEDQVHPFHWCFLYVFCHLLPQARVRTRISQSFSQTLVLVFTFLSTCILYAVVFFGMCAYLTCICQFEDRSIMVYLYLAPSRGHSTAMVAWEKQIEERSVPEWRVGCGMIWAMEFGATQCFFWFCGGNLPG